ncbi:Fes1-domain-containing protein [Microstroma glucosiphilum]|uniref:Fes1-domain-containing protein n=1 Tax=Pseudomicrostroma glucosiphilum TaxID=1684307 RepID=A0A316TY79_9BASI|nr:Fes1-domain-containing protein [Pseudomicrostroma glucosiphilum]PWN18127.1 Fes1-domain-containing protein [Pseudomicrostroma glucosiphilum]
MANNANMDALLKWSMQQQSSDPQAPTPSQLAEDIKAGKRPDLDPKVLEAMMGKSEATMMQEELRAAVDFQRSEDDREVALDNFEMLIESIDNANLITSMKMWSPLLALLSSTSSSPRLQVATLWILGTACQNNPSAQDALLHAHSTPEGAGGEQALDLILAILRDSQDMAVRAKAMYALSALLGHHPRAVKAFGEKGGYEVLKGALRDPSINIRRKTAFLINSLLLQDDSAAHAAASAPLLLGAPPASGSGSGSTSTSTAASDDLPTISTPGAAAAAAATASSATSSRATGVTLPPGSTPDRPVSNPAPLEKPPVTSTAASGIVHPSVPAALLASNLLVTLAYSLLPSSLSSSSSSSSGSGSASASGSGSKSQSAGAEEEDYADARVPSLGLDGDGEEARTDEDYAEKALRALLTFTTRLEEDKQLSAKTRLSEVARRGLREVKSRMSESGSGSGVEGEGEWDWKKLGLEQVDWTEFERAVERIAGQ